MFHLVSWFDLFLNSSLDSYMGLSAHAATPEARAGQRLVIGPWTHAFDPTPGLRKFPGSEFNDLAAAAAWFDQQGRGVRHPVFDHKVIHYVMGANRWRAEESWPPQGIRTTAFYLRGDGLLSVEPPRDDKAEDRYRYDPADPTPSLRGQALLGGCVDQRPNEGRKDRLVYTTAPLDQDVEIAGPVRLRLFASSSATDTDWHVKLIDVFPDGTAYNLTSGAVRARYRTSRTAPTALTPGAIESYDVDMMATSNVFAKGHGIRVVIESSDYPYFDRNPNAFVDLARATSADYVVAEQHIHRDAAHPSRIDLPVIPADRERRWIDQPFWEDRSFAFALTMPDLRKPELPELRAADLPKG